MQFYEMRMPAVDGSEGPFMECGPARGNSTEIVSMCPVCGRGGHYAWKQPYEAEVELVGAPKQWPDFGFDLFGQLLVTDRAIAMMRRLSQQTTYVHGPARIVSLRPRITRLRLFTPTYWYLRVTRTTTAIDEVASGVVWNRDFEYRPCCGGGPKRMQRLCIDGQTWGGADLFRPINLAHSVVTERFVELYHHANLYGAVFCKGDSAAFDHYSDFNNPATDVFPPVMIGKATLQ